MAKDQPTLRDMPSVMMFAGVFVKKFGSEYRANIIPGPRGIGTSGTRGTLDDI
jgi:hypothetical protein